MRSRAWSCRWQRTAGGRRVLPMCPDTRRNVNCERRAAGLGVRPSPARARPCGSQNCPQIMSLPLDPLPGGSAPRSAALRFSQPGAGFARLPRDRQECHPCARTDVLPLSPVAQRGVLGVRRGLYCSIGHDGEDLEAVLCRAVRGEVAERAHLSRAGMSLTNEQAFRLVSNLQFGAALLSAFSIFSFLRWRWRLWALAVLIVAGVLAVVGLTWIPTSGCAGWCAARRLRRVYWKASGRGVRGLVDFFLCVDRVRCSHLLRKHGLPDGLDLIGLDRMCARSEVLARGDIPGNEVGL